MCVRKIFTKTNWSKIRSTFTMKNPQTNTIKQQQQMYILKWKKNVRIQQNYFMQFKTMEKMVKQVQYSSCLGGNFHCGW